MQTGQRLTLLTPLVRRFGLPLRPVTLQPKHSIQAGIQPVDAREAFRQQRGGADAAILQPAPLAGETRLCQRIAAGSRNASRGNTSLRIVRQGLQRVCEVPRRRIQLGRAPQPGVAGNGFLQLLGHPPRRTIGCLDAVPIADLPFRADQPIVDRCLLWKYQEPYRLSFVAELQPA